MVLRKYIIGLLVFTVLLGAMYFFALRQLATGYVDKYYPKFTQKAGGLVVGLSRAQYGLVPAILETSFPEKAKPMINFAFELYQSPYGEILLEDIRTKIHDSITNGLFVLEVSPASFLRPSMISEDQIYNLDSKTILGRMNEVAVHPNYEYLTKCYGSALYKGIFRMRPFGNVVVHQDGWVAFAEQYDFYKVTDVMIREWQQQTLVTYQKVLSMQEKSLSRMQSFVRIIQFLKKHGEVIIVRMPASKEVITFENLHWGTFDSEIREIAKQEQLRFFDYSSQYTSYRFYDGSHLFDSDAKAFTTKLSKDILTRFIE